MISSYKQLLGKKVGGVSGYEAYYSKLIAQGVDIIYAPSELTQMKQFVAHDLDVIIGFLPDWLPHLKQLNYEASFTLHVGYDTMTVRNTPEGRWFVNKISEALQAMHKDGSIEALMGKRYLPFEYHPSQPYEWRSASPF